MNLKSFWAFFRRKQQSLELCQDEIRRGLEEILAGNLKFRFGAKGKEKLALCLEIFNCLMDDLEPLLRQLKEERNEQEGLLSGIEEACAITDSDGKILRGNSSFRNLFGLWRGEGKYVWQVIRSTDFFQMWQNFQQTKEKKEVVINIADKSYLAKIFFLGHSNKPREKIGLILKDISPQKNLEIIKKELVANISHELRTPLTVIKGYLESLEEEKLAEAALSSVAKIKNNVERLERIVKDLLTLSELESRRELDQKEWVNMREIAESVINQFGAGAKEKGLFLRLEGEAEIPPIHGDSFRLEQMLINLVDNALKYTDRGGVIIRLDKGEKELLVMVQDTGIGIAPEHLKRIFERFYVVDKSRSRRLGGTGLGLSIVKHIVLLHNGKIDVKSELGVGTAFTISLPL